eukprot:1667560-Alexandrium_andersonii.AAC.1
MLRAGAGSGPTARWWHARGVVALLLAAVIALGRSVSLLGLGRGSGKLSQGPFGPCCRGQQGKI